MERVGGKGSLGQSIWKCKGGTQKDRLEAMVTARLVIRSIQAGTSINSFKVKCNPDFRKKKTKIGSTIVFSKFRLQVKWKKNPK